MEMVGRGAHRHPPPSPAQWFGSTEAVEVEAEGSGVGSYPTGGWGREMSRDDHRRAIGEGFKKARPRRSCGFRVHAEAAVELGFGALRRVMHDPPAKPHVSWRSLHYDADGAGCAPRPRLDPHVIVEGVVRG